MPVPKSINTIISLLLISLPLTFLIVSLGAKAGEGVPTMLLKQDVEKRQSAFSAIDKNQKEINKELSNSPLNWQNLEYFSSILSEKSGALQHLFIPGSKLESKASDKVWDENMKFKASLEKMNNSFLKMDYAIKQQDITSAKSAMKAATNTCKSCHRKYRSRW